MVTKLVTFGAFARIEGPVEGLIHVSELVDRRIAHPEGSRARGRPAAAEDRAHRARPAPAGPEPARRARRRRANWASSSARSAKSSQVPEDLRARVRGARRAITGAAPSKLAPRCRPSAERTPKRSEARCDAAAAAACADAGRASRSPSRRSRDGTGVCGTQGSIERARGRTMRLKSAAVTHRRRTADEPSDESSRLPSKKRASMAPSKTASDRRSRRSRSMRKPTTTLDDTNVSVRASQIEQR